MVDKSKFIVGMPPDHWCQPNTLVYAPVALEAWWTFEGDLVVGSTILAEKSIFALDTGTSYLTLPAEYYKVFLKNLLPPEHLLRCSQYQLSQIIVCRCDSVEVANVVYIQVSGKKYPIFPEDIFTHISDVSEMDTCILEVQPSDPRLPFILGDTFLRTVVAVFDAGQLQVGLAQRIGHEAILPHTKERLHVDAQRPQSGPLLPPHTVAESNLPFVVMLSPAVLLGVCIGYLCSCLILRVLEHGQRPAIEEQRQPFLVQ